jgi:hypothetical protein
MAAKPPSDANVLATFDGPSASFELAIDRCATEPSQDAAAEERCPIRVRLVAAGKVLDSVPFGLPACGEPSRTTVDSLFGIASNTPAWSTSVQKCAVAVAARPVRVAPEAIGLLATQRQGWEHVARKHWLFTVRGGKLVTAWSADDEGESNLEVRVVESPSGTTDDVAAIDVRKVEGDPDGVAERIRVRRLHWDAPIGRIVATAMPEADFPLFLAYVGPFKSVASARDAAERRQPKCIIPFGIVPASLFPGLGLRGFLRGEVLTSRAEADARKTEAGQCPASLTPKIIEYVPKIEFSPRTQK